MPRNRNHILNAIGNTPLVELRNIVPKDSARIVANSEIRQPYWQYERQACANPHRARRCKGTSPSGRHGGRIHGRDDRHFLGLVASALGYRTHFVFSDAFSDEKRADHARAYGAEITDVLSDDKRITKELIQAMIARGWRNQQSSPGHWWADQLK